MAELNIAEILAAKDTVIRTVPVPEWGKDATVCVRGMTGNEYDEFERTRSAANIRGRLLAWCLCTEAGESQKVTAEQAKLLGAKSCVALDRCCETILALSGVGGGELETTEKN